MLAVWGATAAGLSAIATLPAVELTGQTARARLDYAEASRYSLPPAGLPGLFSPLVFGRGPAGFWGPSERVETGYAGAVTLLLAAAAFLPAHGGDSQPEAGERRRRLAVFLVILSAGGLLIALGGHTPIHYALYRLVPGFAQLRVPARFILLTSFGLSFLAGVGLHNAVKRGLSRRGLWLTVAALAAVGLAAMTAGYWSVIRAAPEANTPQHRMGLLLGAALYASALGVGAVLLDRLRHSGPTPSATPPALALAIVGLIALDVIGLGAGSEVEPNDPTRGYDHPLAIEFLRGQPGPTRMDVAAGQWQPDAALMFGLEDIGGVSNPLALARYDAYYWSVGYRGSPQYNFLGAQFVVAEKGTPPADATFIPVHNEDPDVDVYLNTGARPRVSLVYRSVAAADGPEAFELIHAPEFDPAETVVIEGGPPLAGGGPSGETAIHYVEYGAERIVVEANTPDPAYLVFAEVWYPGWRARVDGQDTPIYRANYAFRAVPLEPGQHSVEMAFEPWTWRAGAAITALTVAALAIWGIRRLAIEGR